MSAALVAQVQAELLKLSDEVIKKVCTVEAIKSIFDKAESAGISKHYLVGGTLIVILLSLCFSFPVGDEEGALDEKVYRDFKLIEREEVSHDVRRFRFALQHKNQLLGLPIGQHIKLCYIDPKTSEEVVRSYTPVSSDDERGYVDFIIKVYKPLPPKFPDGGKMSQFLDNLKLGESIKMRGPVGELEYMGMGNFTISKGFGSKRTEQKHKASMIGLIAGGTGITPMLQIIRAILKNPSDKTQVWLIFANKTEADILLREELDSLVCSRFKLHYTLDEPPANWAHGKGFISEEMCRANLPLPTPHTLVLNCGPPPMIKFAIEPSLIKIGYKEGQWHNF